MDYAILLMLNYISEVNKSHKKTNKKINKYENSKAKKMNNQGKTHASS